MNAQLEVIPNHEVSEFTRSALQRCAKRVFVCSTATSSFRWLLSRYSADLGKKILESYHLVV